MDKIWGHMLTEISQIREWQTLCSFTSMWSWIPNQTKKTQIQTIGGCRSNDWSRGRSGWMWWKGTSFQPQNLEKLPRWLTLYCYWAAQGSTLSPLEGLPVQASTWLGQQFCVGLRYVLDSHEPCRWKAEISFYLCSLWLPVKSVSFSVKWDFWKSHMVLIAQTRQCTRPTSGAQGHPPHKEMRGFSMWERAFCPVRPAPFLFSCGSLPWASRLHISSQPKLSCQINLSGERPLRLPVGLPFRMGSQEN